jgi:hypothetical protein
MQNPTSPLLPHIRFLPPLIPSIPSTGVLSPLPPEIPKRKDMDHKHCFTTLPQENTTNSPEVVTKKVVLILNSKMTSPSGWDLLMSFMDLFFQWNNQCNIPYTPVHKVICSLYKHLLDNIQAHQAHLPLHWKTLDDPFSLSDTQFDTHVDFVGHASTALPQETVTDSPDEVRKKVVQILNSKMSSPSEWELLVSFMDLFFQWINQCCIPSTRIHRIVRWLYRHLLDNIEAHQAHLPLPWKSVDDPYALSEAGFDLLVDFVEQGIFRGITTDGKSVEMEIESSMYDVAVEFGLTSNEQHMIAFTKVCSSFLLRILNKGFVKTSFVGGAVEDQLRQNLTVARGRLQGLGGKDDLLLLLITQDDAHSEKTRVIIAAREFCHRFNTQIKPLFVDNTSFDTAHVHLDSPDIAGDIRKVELNASLEDKWNNIEIIFVDEMSSISTKRLEELDLVLRRVKNEPDEMFGALCMTFAGCAEAVESVRKYTSGLAFIG